MLDLPSEITVSLGPTDLSEVVPMKFLADAVVIVADKATGSPLWSSSSSHRAGTTRPRNSRGRSTSPSSAGTSSCQRAFLLVMCPDPDRSEEVSPRHLNGSSPGSTSAPEVIDPLNAPGVGSASPYLAIFAAFMGAMNLDEDQGVRAFLTAVRESGASAADRKRLSTIMLNLRPTQPVGDWRR